MSKSRNDKIQHTVLWALLEILLFFVIFNNKNMCNMGAVYVSLI